MTTEKTNASSGSSAAESPRPKAGPGDIVKDVKEIANEAAGQAKEVAENQISVRKDKALDTLGNVARALRETSGRLGSEKETAATDYVMRAADGVDRVAQYLRSRDLSRVVEDVESFARREPAIFLGGAFVAGLIGSRFLKSSRTPAERPSGDPPRTNGDRVQVGPRTATGGAWPSEGGSGPRPRGEGLASPLQSSPSDTRSNLSETKRHVGAGGPPPWSATPGGSGQPVINQSDVTSTQPKTPVRTPGYGVPPPEASKTGQGVSQGSVPSGMGSRAPQGKP
jgi:hypothetical protein